MPRTIDGIKLYEVHEIAKDLGISENTIRGYLKSGKLKGKKLGKKWFVPAQSLKEYFGQESGEEEQKE